MNDQQGRWINFYKPVGMRSTKAVALVKNKYNARKAGHAGTLDPLADGVLPIALNSATKQMSEVVGTSKEYFFTIEFGKQTETDDAEGAVIAQSEILPTYAQIEECIKSKFLGEIQQLPPAYSAIKVNGVRSYKAARAGKSVVLTSRPVTIYSLEIVNTDDIEQLNAVRASLSEDIPTPPLFLNQYNDAERVNMITLKAHVSKGTYVRSLARDIGLLVGCYGYVKVLTRTRVGDFAI